MKSLSYVSGPANMQTIHGVYLSDTLDLEALYGEALRDLATDVVLHRPEEIERPEDIRFAICWLPETDAFAPYENLTLAMSIGAGVDALLAHPGLGPDMAIARVRDPHQAALMAGYVAHEILHKTRQFAPMMDNAAAQLWRPYPLEAPERTVVAVLGHGTMGRAVVSALCGLGYSLRVACRTQPDQPLDHVTYLTGETAVSEAAQTADFLVNVLPLTTATENVLNAELFGALNTGAHVIQIGRGEHLVEADLIAALDSGQLSGATLDVFRTEPLPKDDPMWRDPRLRITPHIASDSLPDVVAEQVIETARSLRDQRAMAYQIDRNRGY